ncbi:PDZ domain-containing protein [Stieleria varia]|uniref:Putative periplasmic serine endoprotease DegP-like n=1 Tax=Stieleria varia TaxID=2528005 RepID=A0A5C6B1Q9_9BACT|nr:PDZ domain-containing protein [Stieleria varia]TWU05830.1 putative periplasmic serine endoprotease DegP-like precursor [Stieleria varia]
MPCSTFRTRYGRLSLSIAALAVIPLAGISANTTFGDEPKQAAVSDQDDAKSASLSDEHADDESPQLGVIVGSCPGEGVCVLDTVWGSPAHEAGIMHGDYILTLDGTEVSTPRELMDALKKTKGGDTATIGLWRQGETMEQKVMLASKADKPPASHGAWLGVMLSPDQDDKGVRIEKVMRGSPASDAGLRSGDVIVQREQSAISSVRSFAESIEDMEPGTELQLTVHRNGDPMQMKVTVGDLDEAPMRFMRESQNAFQSMGGRSQYSAGREESSEMLEETLDELRKRIRELEKSIREMKPSDDISQRSDVLGSDGTMLVVQRDQRRRGYDGRNRGRNWDNDFYDWRSRYRSGYRYPLYRSPRYGNSYYRYGGRPYYGNFGRSYGYGRSGFRIGNFGVWW